MEIPTDLEVQKPNLLHGKRLSMAWLQANTSLIGSCICSHVFHIESLLVACPNRFVTFTSRPCKHEFLGGLEPEQDHCGCSKYGGMIFSLGLGLYVQ